jgi:transcriptional regulator with XRE-family HTH domain
MAETGSSVPRRQLGRYLKRSREEAQISLEAAARDLEWSRARMYRIEAGQTSVRSLDVEQMCKLYGTTPEMTEALTALAKESKSRGWWQAYGEVLPDWFELYVGLEAAASRIRQYAMGLIPGLLQTSEYAEAVFRNFPANTESDIEQKIAFRNDRQRLLTRRRPAAPTLDVILAEDLLRRPIADLDGWQRQLAHLANVTRAAKVSVRLLPSALGPYRASVTGGFVILDFPTAGTRTPEPTTIYSENLTGALYLDKPKEVATYVEVWQALDQLALGARESEDLISTIIKEC